jgi:hypothetical protein
LATGDCAVMPPQDKNMLRLLQISISNCLFKFFKLDNQQLKITHNQIAKKEPEVSSTFTCHTWLPDGRIAVCTDMGQIMLLDYNGDYKQIQAYDPKKASFPIYSIIPYQFGGIDHTQPANLITR